MLLVCNALSMQYNFDAALGGTFTACVCICICICNHSRHGSYFSLLARSHLTGSHPIMSAYRSPCW